MTRAECEAKVESLLDQIRDVVMEYVPNFGDREIRYCIMAVGVNWLSAFILGENNEHLLDVNVLNGEG